MENEGDGEWSRAFFYRNAQEVPPCKLNSKLRLKEEKDLGENEKTEGNHFLDKENSMCKGPEIHSTCLIVEFKDNH